MVGMTAILRGRDWSRADRDALPDDGRRYEVVDGALVVTPSPSTAHQIVVFGLYRQLYQACPGHLRVLELRWTSSWTTAPSSSQTCW